MIDLIGPANWAAYKALMRDVQETFGKKVITWRKSTGGLDQHGEDNSEELFTPISLEVIISHNVFRTWPITRLGDAGEVDRENTVLIINKDYLSEIGHLTVNGNFNFSPAADRFVISGQVYKCQGFTDAAQASDDPLWVYIIIEKEEVSTGSPEVP